MTWKRVRLKDIGTWYGGGTPSKSDPTFWTGGDVPWLSPKDMGPDVLVATIDHVTPAAVAGSSTKLVPAGSVAVVTRSGILERTIPVAVVPFATTMNQDMKGVVPHEGIDPRWIAWGLRANERELLRKTRKAGTTVASIEMPRFYDFELPVPELDEQRRIVAILEDHLSRLEAADVAVTDAVRRVEGFRAGVLREAFRRCAAPVRPLLEVVTIANGQTPKGLVENLTAHRGDEAVPFFKVGDMNAGDGRWMDQARFFTPKQVAARLGLHIRPSGTVLIPKRGGAIATNKKRILREPACYDLNTMGLIPGAELESAYLWHWLRTVDLGRIADGSNVPQINAAQIREMSLPVPTKEMQRSICDHLDAMGDQVARLEHEIAVARQRARTLRSALLAGAISGKLTVKEHAGV